MIEICYVNKKDESGSQKWISRWLLSGCVLIMLMVVIGGITRLTHSGLSMVKWSLFGSLPPTDEASWTTLFNQYQQSPEYQLINHNFTLADFKNIFWWEFIHRMIGRTIGVVFIVPFTWFLIRKKFTRPLLLKVGVVFLLGLVQGFIGWFMVKSGLDKVPHVSHYFLALHLITAFTTFAVTFWIALDLKRPIWEGNSIAKAVRILSHTLLVFIGLQVVYGGFVAGLRAGWLFPQFPKMGDAWIAPDAYSMEPFWKNVLENGAGVQFVHRTLAWLIVMNSVLLVYTAWKRKITGPAWRSIQLLAVAVLVQFSLGVTTLLLHVPVVVASLHQVSAFVLLGAAVYTLHTQRRESDVHDRISHHTDSGGPGKNNESETDTNKVTRSGDEGNNIAHAQSEEQPAKTEKKKHVDAFVSAKQDSASLPKNDLKYVYA